MLLWTLGHMYLFKLVGFFFSHIYPGVELLSHIVAVILIFWATSIMFSIVTAPIYISPNRVQGFPFTYILTNICSMCSFWWQQFWQMWGDTSLWFWFASPRRLVMLSIFSYACWPIAFPLWKNVYTVLLTIFNQIWGGFLWCWLYELFIYIGCWSLISHIIPNIFSHSVSCLLISSIVSFAMQNVLRLIRSH